MCYWVICQSLSKLKFGLIFFKELQFKQFAEGRNIKSALSVIDESIVYSYAINNALLEHEERTQKLGQTRAQNS